MDRALQQIILGHALEGTRITAPTLTDARTIASAANKVPLTTWGVASQTADLQEWRDSADTVLANITPTGGVSLSDVVRGKTSLWYRATHVCAFSASPGASGATFTVPSANTLGGYQLNAATEYLYFGDSITSMWDGESDLFFRATFEVNADNTGGATTDTVDLQLICYYKGGAETAVKSQTIEVATVVGKSARYKRFATIFTIDWDAVDNVVEVGDKMTFRLALVTATSEVSDVIINIVMFRYKTARMNPEV